MSRSGLEMGGIAFYLVPQLSALVQNIFLFFCVYSPITFYAYLHTSNGAKSELL
jgi:hypothetical protein